MSRSPRPSSAALGALAVAAVVGLPASLPSAALAAAAGADRLHLTFEEGGLADGDRVEDASGTGNDGVVTAPAGSRLRGTPDDEGGRGARFRRHCPGEGRGEGEARGRPECSPTVITVPPATSLDVGTAPFAWGAQVRVHPWQASDGANVVQRGLWGSPDGQWKLQVDGAAAVPSCVVSGPGGADRVTVSGPEGVADGQWHDLECRRAGGEVVLVVDGRAVARADQEAVRLDGVQPVVIGGKGLGPENDQFLGALDDVRVRLL